MPTAPMQTLSVASASYPTDPQVELKFEPDQYTFFNESTTLTEDVLISFDGSTNHGILLANTPLAALNWMTKQRKVWFKQRTAGAAIQIRVMAGTVI